MIILLITIILFIFFSIPIRYQLKKNYDLFSPSVIISFIHIITIIPYLIYVAFNNNAISPLVRNHYSYKSAEESVIYYALIQLIAFIFLQIGIMKPISFTRKKISINVIKENKAVILFAFGVTFAIGIISYFYIIGILGGYSYILNNLYRRTQILSGNAYLLTLTNLLPLSVYLYIYSFRYRKINKFSYISIVILVILTIMLSSLFGGRKGSIYFVITCLIVWHYGISKIKLVSGKNILLVLLFSIYFIVMPLLRVPGAVEDLTKNKGLLTDAIIENFDILIEQTSYVDHYLLIVNHFGIDNLWLGISYIDLLKAPIPSKIYQNKPPVDEGVYLRTIAEGINVKPSVPFNQLYKSSWPPETLGIMYMNFWIPGVIIGMYILGNVYRKTYIFMVRSKYSIFSIILYGTVITNFHLSNLRITQTIINIVFYTFVFLIFFGLARDEKAKSISR